jgi:hypothetical protein
MMGTFSEGPIVRLLSLLALAACAPAPGPAPAEVVPVAAEADAPHALPAESDLPPSDAGRWSLACGATLTLATGGVLALQTQGDPETLPGVAVGLPAISTDGARVAWSRAPRQPPETEIAVMTCEGGTWGAPRTLARGPGSPDRAAITPDGAWVLWFSSVSGVPALWTAPFAGGEPKQITNRGVTREGASPGHPPTGFLPPPHRGTVSVEALDGGRYRARWEGPDGEHAAELP